MHSALGDLIKEIVEGAAEKKDLKNLVDISMVRVLAKEQDLQSSYSTSCPSSPDRGVQ